MLILVFIQSRTWLSKTVRMPSCRCSCLRGVCRYVTAIVDRTAATVITAAHAVQSLWKWTSYFASPLQPESSVFSSGRQGSFRLVIVSGWGHSRISTRFTVRESPNPSAGSITYTSFFPFLATTLYTFPSQTSWILLRPWMSRFLRYTRCPNYTGRSRAVRSKCFLRQYISFAY